MVGVPTIDLHDLSNESLVELDRACVDHGFFKLIGHDLDDLIDAVHHQAELFFDAPRNIKTSILRPEHSPYGYFDRELTKGKRDKKEVFDYHGKPTDSDKEDAFEFWPQNENGQNEAGQTPEEVRDILEGMVKNKNSPAVIINACSPSQTENNSTIRGVIESLCSSPDAKDDNKVVHIDC